MSDPIERAAGEALALGRRIAEVLGDAPEHIATGALAEAMALRIAHHTDDDARAIVSLWLATLNDLVVETRAAREAQRN